MRLKVFIESPSVIFGEFHSIITSSKIWYSSLLNNICFALISIGFFIPSGEHKKGSRVTFLFLKNDLHFLPKGAGFPSFLFPFLLSMHIIVESSRRICFTQRYLCVYTGIHT